MGLKLKGQQVEAFRDALCSALPSWGYLDEIVEFQDQPPLIRYSTHALPSSSDSPCFSMTWDLVDCTRQEKSR